MANVTPTAGNAFCIEGLLPHQHDRRGELDTPYTPSTPCCEPQVTQVTKDFYTNKWGGSLGRQAKQMPHALLLREEVLVVLLVRLRHDRDALDDLDAQFLQGFALRRIVRE